MLYFSSAVIFIILVNQIQANTDACNLQCTTEDQDDVPCMAQNIGTNCNIPEDATDLFVTPNRYLPPRAAKVQLLKYTSNANNTYYGIQWRLDKHSGGKIKTLKGFLVRIKFFMSGRYQFYLLKTEHNFTPKNKKIAFHINCINIQDDKSIEVRVWSLPSVSRIKKKRKNYTRHICNTKFNNRYLLNVGQGIETNLLTVSKAKDMNITKVPQKYVIKVKCFRKEDVNITSTPDNIVVETVLPQRHKILIGILTLDGQRIGRVISMNERQISAVINITHPGNYTVKLNVKSEVESCKNKRLIKRVEITRGLALAVAQSTLQQNKPLMTIIFIICGTVFVIILIIAVAYFLIRKRKSETYFKRRTDGDRNGFNVFNNFESGQSNFNKGDDDPLISDVGCPRVMVISCNNDTRPANVAVIKSLSQLFTISSVHSYNFYDHLVQENLMKNRFDWLEKIVRESDHFVFVATKELCELFKARRSAEADDRNNSLCRDDSDLATYTFSLIRGKLGIEKRCHIVSFGDSNSNRLLEEIASFYHLFDKARKYELTKIITRNKIIDITFNNAMWNKLVKNILARNVSVLPTSIFTNVQRHFLENVKECILSTESTVGDSKNEQHFDEISEISAESNVILYEYETVI